MGTRNQIRSSNRVNVPLVKTTLRECREPDIDRSTVLEDVPSALGNEVASRENASTGAIAAERSSVSDSNPALTAPELEAPALAGSGDDGAFSLASHRWRRELGGGEEGFTEPVVKEEVAGKIGRKEGDLDGSDNIILKNINL